MWRGTVALESEERRFFDFGVVSSFFAGEAGMDWALVLYMSSPP